MGLWRPAAAGEAAANPIAMTATRRVMTAVKCVRMKILRERWDESATCYPGSTETNGRPRPRRMERREAANMRGTTRLAGLSARLSDVTGARCPIAPSPALLVRRGGGTLAETAALERVAGRPVCHRGGLAMASAAVTPTPSTFAPIRRSVPCRSCPSHDHPWPFGDTVPGAPHRHKYRSERLSCDRLERLAASRFVK